MGAGKWHRKNLKDKSFSQFLTEEEIKRIEEMTSAKCPHCFEVLDGKPKVCPKCGKEIEQC